MPFAIEKLAGEPIVRVKVSSPFDVRQDLPQLAQQLHAAFDAEEGPLWDITDVRDLSIGFGDMVYAMALMTRGELAVLNHPKLRRFVVIASSSLLLIAAKALGQQQYGAIPVMICETPDDALAVVRAEIPQTITNAA